MAQITIVVHRDSKAIRRTTIYLESKSWNCGQSCHGNPIRELRTKGMAGCLLARHPRHERQKRAVGKNWMNASFVPQWDAYLRESGFAPVEFPSINTTQAIHPQFLTEDSSVKARQGMCTLAPFRSSKAGVTATVVRDSWRKNSRCR